MKAFSGDEEEVLQGGEKNDKGYQSLQGKKDSSAQESARGTELTCLNE